MENQSSENIGTKNDTQTHETLTFSSGGESR
jgi:hypothetical protein